MKQVLSQVISYFLFFSFLFLSHNLFQNAWCKICIISIIVHHGILTPAYTDEHPFPQFVGGVCQYYGCVQIAALSKHPEEVGHMEIIIRCCNQPAPDLRAMREREIQLDV